MGYAISLKYSQKKGANHSSSLPPFCWLEFVIPIVPAAVFGMGAVSSRAIRKASRPAAAWGWLPPTDPQVRGENTSLLLPGLLPFISCFPQLGLVASCRPVYYEIFLVLLLHGFLRSILSSRVKLVLGVLNTQVEMTKRDSPPSASGRTPHFQHRGAVAQSPGQGTRSHTPVSVAKILKEKTRND